VILSALTLALGGFRDQAAGEVANEASKRLLTALANDKEKENWEDLLKALAAIGGRLGEADAAAVTKWLIAAIKSQVSVEIPDPATDNLGELLDALKAVAGRLPVSDASSVAHTLLTALESDREGENRKAILETMTAVSERLSDQEASTTARKLWSLVISETSDAWLKDYVEAISALGPRVPENIARQLAERCLAAADRLTGGEPMHVHVATPSGELSERAALAAALSRVPVELPKPAIKALIEALLLSEPVFYGQENYVDALPGFAKSFIASGSANNWQSANVRALSGFAKQLDTQELVEILKSPFCIDAAQTAVLNLLEQKTGNKFGGDIWEFAAQAEKLGLDVKSPPVRPRMVFSSLPKK
jgi:hypothetical protein